MKKIKVLLLLIIVGFIIVALPDSDVRLFSISKEHGPSIQDTIGLSLILIAYTWLLFEAWNKRHKVLKYQESIAFKLGLFLFGLGYGLVIASVANDFRYWWVYGIGLLVLIQATIFYLAFK